MPDFAPREQAEAAATMACAFDLLQRRLPEVMRAAGCAAEAIAEVNRWVHDEAIPRIAAGASTGAAQAERAGRLALEYMPEILAKYGENWRANPAAVEEFTARYEAILKSIQNVDAGGGAATLG
ncbi:MAG: hypothetical protein JSS36_06505 [Proteobacteria bacterium]|nr:hypothetical protein [Pseudomonadota bacterium]